jgi:hypothetical protein
VSTRGVTVPVDQKMLGNMERDSPCRTRYDGGSFEQVTTLLESHNATKPSLPTTSCRYICQVAAAAADDDDPSQSPLSKEAHSSPRPVSYKTTHRLRKLHLPSISASSFSRQFPPKTPHRHLDRLMRFRSTRIVFTSQPDSTRLIR